MEKYPILGEIKRICKETLDVSQTEIPCGGMKVRLRVMDADKELMARSPFLISRSGDCSYLFRRKRGKGIRNAWQKEWIFAVGQTCILNWLSWPGNSENANQGCFFRQVFQLGIDYVYEETEHLIWVTLRTYVIREGDKGSREILKKDMDIVIYNKPDIGFRRLCEESLSENISDNFPVPMNIE